MQEVCFVLKQVCVEAFMARRYARLCAVSVMSIAAATLLSVSAFAASSIALAPAAMMRIGEIDARFQSYNIEMVEVTGGYFWRPYRDGAKTSSSTAIPAGMDPSMFAYRSPIDLSNARLRKLAAALGPAYLRVSGTWANATYFDVLTRTQWNGVIDFARAADAKLVTSFATVAGTRDASGAWTPTQADRLIAFTHATGGSIAAAEFMNEPDLSAMGSTPAGYDAASFARDIAAFRSFLVRASPHTILLGPGIVSGEGADGALSADKLLAASGSMFDAVSYHHYGAPSQRCTKAAARSDAALLDDWLSGAERAETFYAGLRDRYAPGRALWITETADASCGGNPSDVTFLDSFRYLDLLGRMAQRGVRVVMHNTLAASDYGLLDERDFAPRPNYWAALLWRRLMGTTVLDPGASPAPQLHLYAHCLRGQQGGVALLAINKDRTHAQSLGLPARASRYTLTAADLTDMRVRLNGRDLRLDARDDLPTLQGEPVAAGQLDLPPASITLLAVADAANPACR
jgi:heparanase